MEIQPSALFDLPFVAGALRLSGWILAGVAGLTASLVAGCTATEYLTQRRSKVQQHVPGDAATRVHVPSTR